MSKIVQVRDVPDEVHRRLKMRAVAEGRTLSELVRDQLIEAASRPTLAEMMDRLASLAPVTAPEPAAEAVRAGRAERWSS